MGSRTLPTECQHGVVIDHGDFGPCQDCDDHDLGDCPNFVDCEQCSGETAQRRSDDRELAARVVAEFQHRNESLHRHHDLSKPTCSYCDLVGIYALAALDAAGFVVTSTT